VVDGGYAQVLRMEMRESRSDGMGRKEATGQLRGIIVRTATQIV
jgi:hypothetical protein